MTGGKSSQRKYELSNLESYLQANMLPVAPRMEFVSGLKNRLFEAAGRPDMARNGRLAPNILKLILLTIAGVISSVLMIFTSVRAIVKLVGAVRQIRQQVEQKPAAPLTPAA